MATLARACRTSLSRGAVIYLRSNLVNNTSFNRLDFLLTTRCFSTSMSKLSGEGPTCVAPVVEYEQVVSALSSDKSLVIDVREPKELTNDGEIPGAINIPLGQVGDALSLAPDKFRALYGCVAPEEAEQLVFSCKLGIRSNTAATIAKDLGLQNMHNYKGGWIDWAEKTGK